MEPKNGNSGRCVRVSTQQYLADKERKKRILVGKKQIHSKTERRPKKFDY